MDWTNIINGLGNFGDIASGRESYNTIKRGNQNYALGQDTLAQQANLAAQQRALQQQLQSQSQGFTSGENALDRSQRAQLQGSSQAFQMGQNQLDRDQRFSLQQSAQGFQSEEGALERAARAQAQQNALQNAIDLANKQYAHEDQPIGGLGSVVGLPPETSSYGLRSISPFMAADVGMQKQKRMLQLLEELRGIKPGTGILTPRPAGAPSVRLKLGGNN